MDFLDIIEEVSEKATREIALENGKFAMEREWEEIRFNLVAYKQTSTYIMIDNEPIWQLLDEQLMRTLSMCGSPYIEFMEREMHAWKSGLLRV